MKRQNNKSKKVSFLVHRKSINDKFFDLVSTKVKSIPNSKGKFIRHGIGTLADELEISVSTLNRYIKRGFINEANEELFINVERNFDKIKKIKRTKKVTKEFSIHTFTKDNFFPKKNLGRTKKNEQYYFRCGLYLRFKSGKKGFYTIQNLPISHYTNSYSKGYDEFFEIIKLRLEEFPSLLFFRFNYFDVEKINVGTIDERIETFQNKHKKNNEKTKNKKRKK